MTRWARINLVLGVLAAGLLALHLWPQGPQSAAGLLTDLDADAIQGIRIERGRRLTLALARDAGGWTLTHPQPRPANAHRVAQLLAIALAPVSFRYTLAGDAERYGLDEPAAVLQLDDRRLSFGDRDPTQQGRYVRVGDEVCVVDDLYFNLLTLPARHYATD